MVPDKPSSDQIRTDISRRTLFRTVGLATGGAMLLGLPKFIGSWGGTAEAAVARTCLRREYCAGVGWRTGWIGAVRRGWECLC